MKTASLILLIGFLSIYLSAICLGQAQLPEYAPGEVIIKLTAQAYGNPQFKIMKNGNTVTTGIQSLDEIGGAISARSIHRVIPEEHLRQGTSPQGLERALVVRFPAKHNVKDVVNIYSKNPNVEYAQPNFLYYASYSPNDYYFATSQQWAIPKIQAPEAWDITKGSPNSKIVILDSGVDLIHPDLVNNIYPGYDFVRVDTMAWKAAGYKFFPNVDYTEQDNDPMDHSYYTSTKGIDGHGTRVAGIAGATTDNSIGVASVGYNCKIVPARVLFPVEDPWGSWYHTGQSSDIAFGIWWSNTYDVKVINMSFSGPFSDQVEKDAIDNGYYTWGVVYVGSAGNNNSPNGVNYPARYSEVISAGASEPNDIRWVSQLNPASGSNYGTRLDVMAPNRVYSTLYRPGSGYEPIHAYMGFEGTSASAPHVSGLVGLIRTLDPSLTPAQVKGMIVATCDQVGGYYYDPVTGISTEMGYGRINAYRALSRTLNQPRIIPLNDGINAATIESSSQENTKGVLEVRNYPNPFNPSTKVRFYNPIEGRVMIKVSDVLGREVQTLMDDHVSSGWHQTTFDGSPFPSGVYFLSVYSGRNVSTTRLVLIK